MKTALLVFLAAALALCIDQSDFFSTESGPIKTTPIYHASLMIEGRGKIIHVDPSSKANYKGLPKADLILITQDNPEHLDPEGIARISKKSTAILAPPGPAPRLQHCTAITPPESVSFGDVAIQAIPAYFPGQDRAHSNGYVLTYPGFRIYISGDTGLIPEMKALKNVDVAFLSMGSPDTMSLEDAAAVVKLIKPKTLYPDHYRDTNVDEIKKQLAVPGTELRMRYWY